ncbi:hypothetical protein V6N13_054510 [Hibiscus sabdariffa]
MSTLADHLDFGQDGAKDGSKPHLIFIANYVSDVVAGTRTIPTWSSAELIIIAELSARKQLHDGKILAVFSVVASFARVSMVIEICPQSDSEWKDHMTVC